MKAFLLTLLPGLTLLTTSLPAAEMTAATRRIDELLARGWEKHHLQPHAPVGDEVFLRRAYLTVVGRIPTLDEARSFLAWQEPTKREKLIDSLLASEGYVHHFFNYWADVFRAQSQGVADSTTAQNYLNYLRQALRDNKPYDQLARELVSSEGACFENGAIGYYMRDRGMPLDNLSNTTRIFLGTRMECAQCHDHPFDKWTQKQFYEMAAFTHNMTASAYRSPGAEEVQKLIRQDKSLDKETQDLMRQAITEVTRPLRDTWVKQNKAALRLPHDYKYPDAKPKDVVQASVMFGKPVSLTKDANQAKVFSAWLTARDNPRFTTVIVNRLWKKVFGLGLIEPLDELMDGSVAANPELEAFLERQMVSMKYDMKAFLKMLLTTQTFARVSLPEVGMGEPCYFQGPVFRRMSAEQAWDSLVTLVNPEPDSINWTAREREKRELDNRRQLAGLLDLTEAPLLFEASERVAVAMREQNKEFDQLRKELDVARAQEDKDKAKEIQRRLGESQRILRQTVSRCFYEAAQKSNNKEVQAKLAEVGGDGPMEMAMMSLMESARVDASDMPGEVMDLQQVQADAKRLGIQDQKTLKSYVTYRKNLHQTWSRAAELTSPAPRGHFLREYGQSDRDVIENSSDEASVPQALAMMNSSLVSQITGGWSVLSMNLRQAKTDEEKLEVLYLSIFSRLPTEHERDVMSQRLESYAGRQTRWEDVALAALSTQQFLFVK
ncbi:Protein of unknown function [Prosthecobacter debontii]|uniref:DUF1549 domain-containing protein n=1 Tax=Prosthecobacter debontii TaxID=48467 RepID=A0A1T4XSI5_9BACT|nr:DUF1549 domain-containing protein [Prosthecobacter debontii]SKA92520.1 Protein of unknown function [Prosthecobacter debontii]